MWVPLVVFLLVVGAVMGGYAVAVSLPGILASRRLDRRLRDVSAPADAEVVDSTVVKRSAEGPLPSLDRVVSKTSAGSWLARLIDQSGTRTTVSAVLVMALTAGAAAAIGAEMFVRLPFTPLAAGLFGAAAPFAWLRHRRTARLKKFEEQFPEALDLLSRAIRAGHAFQTAMGMVADELPQPVGPEFRKTFDEQNFGLPLREALAQLADRVPLLDVRFFVTAVLIQRDTGGNLSEILDNLAHVVRERFKILRQVRVHTAHGRFTGYVLLALPAALGIVLSFINPEHMGLLFHEHLGQMLLMAAMVLQTIGFLWIRKVIKIEV
jgi:tight adherence protein B